jgi:Domain of unknown function (DUF4942)
LNTVDTTALTLANNTEIALASQAEEAERTASHMAREFQEATAEIAQLMLAIQTQSQRMRSAFDPDGEITYSPFDLDFKYDGQQYNAEDFDRIREKMARRAWRILFDHLGVKNVMSVKKRGEFEHQLERGDLPEVTEANIIGVIAGLAGDAKEFARDAAKEVFDMLRPAKGWGGDYKTNNAFRVGRKVILPHRVERCWNGKTYRANYHREKELVALDGVFHLLDGKGVMREPRGPLCKAIEASPDGRGETDFFAFKCFKNGNLHLTMKRLDLVKELNGLAAGEYVLGEDLE